MDDTGVVVRRHKLDVEDYHRMAEAGILGEDDRVELIDGEIIDMAPIGQPHAGTVGWLNQTLVMAFGDRAIVWPQNPIRLDRLNEPQPDFAVLRPRADFYRTGEPPGPEDVLLLIEVADSSLRFDRNVKLPLYARAGIPEVWIVDLRHREVRTYRGPGETGYGETSTHRPGDTMALALVPGISLSLDRLLG